MDYTETTGHTIQEALEAAMDGHTVFLEQFDDNPCPAQFGLNHHSQECLVWTNGTEDSVQCNSSTLSNKWIIRKKVEKPKYKKVEVVDDGEVIRCRERYGPRLNTFIDAHTNRGTLVGFMFEGDDVVRDTPNMFVDCSGFSPCARLQALHNGQSKPAKLEYVVVREV